MPVFGVMESCSDEEHRDSSSVESNTSTINTNAVAAANAPPFDVVGLSNDSSDGPTIGFARHDHHDVEGQSTCTNGTEGDLSGNNRINSNKRRRASNQGNATGATAAVHGGSNTSTEGNNKKEAIAFLEEKKFPSKDYIVLGNGFVAFVKVTNDDHDEAEAKLQPLFDEDIEEDELYSYGHRVNEHTAEEVEVILDNRKELFARKLAPAEANRIAAVDSFYNHSLRKRGGHTIDELRSNLGYCVSLIHATRLGPWHLIPFGWPMYKQPFPKDELVIVPASKLIKMKMMENPTNAQKKKKETNTRVCFTMTMADAFQIVEITENDFGFFYFCHPTNEASLDAKQMPSSDSHYCHSHYCHSSKFLYADACLMYLKLSDGRYLFAWIWQKEAHGPFSLLADFITRCKILLTMIKQFVHLHWRAHNIFLFFQ